MASPPEIKVTVCGKTDVGLLREHNEDNLLVVDFAQAEKTPPDTVLEFQLSEKGALFLVCDGMGGAAAGEVASTMAVESISASVAAAGPVNRERFARRVRRSIEEANARIFVESRDNQNERGMGTTCTAVGLVDGMLLVGQIGDSRCYVLRGQTLSLTTKDQSLAWQLIEAGAMTAEEAKGFEHTNIILQALGVQERVEVVLSQVSLRKGDVVLVCSDGLHGPVSDDEIKQILLEEPDVRKACDRLIARANEHEGPDNITAVVARFDGAGLADPSEEDKVGFLSYDPGQDPEDPEPPPPVMSEKATGEIPPLRQALDLAGGQDVPVNDEAIVQDTPLPSPSSQVTQPPPSSAPDPEARPLLAFVLLLLLAAGAGALFLIYQREVIPDRSFGQSSLAADHETPPAPAADHGSDSDGDAGR
jgi:PPM family protein phosphatase